MNMQQSYRKPMMIAIVLHVFIFIMLAMSFQLSGEHFVYENSNTPQIINAMVMPSSPPAQPKVAPAPPVPTPALVQPAPAPVKPPQPIKQPTPPPVPVKPIEKPHVAPPKTDAIALLKKQQKKLQKDLLEKQLLTELKQQKVQQKVLQKKLKQKELEEALASEVKNLSAKKKQSQRDAQRIAGEREQKAQGQVDKYKALVLQTIGQHWLIPNGVDKKLAAKLVIYLAPGGMVLGADIYESSGNVALDNSARAAVFKASPLPVPPDPEGFKFFKRFVLVFRPMSFENGQFGLGASSMQELNG